MTQPPPLNPIQLRLRTLEGLWNEFASDKDARILRWIADDDSTQLIQTFINLQSEPVSDIPDLFIELKSPFLNADNWNSQLIEEFAGLISENRTDIESLGIVLRWNPPPAGTIPTLNSLLDSLVAFTKAAESLAEHVAIAINPSAVTHPQQLSLWLQQLAKLPIPESLRFIVIDPAAHPRFQNLEDSPVVRSVDPQLNMPQAYEQIAAEAGPPGPGHDFRRYYVAVTNAAGIGDTAKAEQAAAKAIEIALREKWHHLACTAQMALGAAWLAAGKPEKMLAACQTSIAYLHGLTDDVSKKLLVTLRMSEGSACIAASQNSAAAAAFQLAAAAAAQITDHRAELESWRMAAWCLEQDGQPQPAWDCSLKTLAAATQLPPDQRSLTHLPWAGETMLRLARKDKQRQQFTEEQMNTLLGEDWKSLLKTGAV